jgi:hypothetical protein
VGSGGVWIPTIEADSHGCNRVLQCVAARGAHAEVLQFEMWLVCVLVYSRMLESKEKLRRHEASLADLGNRAIRGGLHIVRIEVEYRQMQEPNGPDVEAFRRDISRVAPGNLGR